MCELTKEERNQIVPGCDICECCGGGTEAGYRFCTQCQELCGKVKYDGND